ncbi:hypothetical protein OG887_06750 [Streptomyces sp. NBC_00053]|uniref:hypothetical protein n=1 Tax=unclassified Streptomyces TaxID=2593676 RepID=UPI00225180A8|nr:MULTISPECIES: hypothetical protein [unclassified Streptomyces]MCX5099226.1 hypothetical protein [Streptomyces sp. NBC_00439]MCX5158771.1 hypothetical protein [Streptomyces sp. NBC_00305]MCX5217294.1 hypothetical protein [Streptomyces sp. NBC_00264]MCX5499090.1 hypothetical protein [Streptomyces sp. NBC_00052]MCX5552375.1 hypothetical protein [Streptomyces sp. NBC_00051]
MYRYAGNVVGAPVGVFEEAAFAAFDLAFSVNGTLVRRSMGVSWGMPFEAVDPARESYPFTARLARANCLPPAYLRRFLAGPPRCHGRPSRARIAAVTGRDPEQLRKTLDTVKCKRCGSEFAVTRTFGVIPRYCRSLAETG